jgi:hypothetical protein
MTAILAQVRSRSCPTGSNPARPNCPVAPAAQRAPLRAEVTVPANCQVVQEAAKESAPVVRPQVEVTAPAHSLDVPVRAIDQEHVRLEAAKGTDLEYVRLEAAKATAPERVRLEAAKVIGQDDRQEVAKGTDPERDRRGSAIRIVPPSQDLRLPVDRRERVLQGSDRQAGAPRAIGPLDGGHQCIARPLPVLRSGTRGTDPAIARQATGGDQ